MKLRRNPPRQLEDYPGLRKINFSGGSRGIKEEKTAHAYICM